MFERIVTANAVRFSKQCFNYPSCIIHSEKNLVENRNVNHTAGQEGGVCFFYGCNVCIIIFTLYR